MGLGAVIGGVVLVDVGALITPRPNEPYRLLLVPPCVCATFIGLCGLGVLDKPLPAAVLTSTFSSLVSGV